MNYLPQGFVQGVWVVAAGRYEWPSVVVHGVFHTKVEAISEALATPGTIIGGLVNWGSAALPEPGRRLAVVHVVPRGPMGFYPIYLQGLPSSAHAEDVKENPIDRPKAAAAINRLRGELEMLTQLLEDEQLPEEEEALITRRVDGMLAAVGAGEMSVGEVRSEVEEINRALLEGTLGLTESGLAVPGARRAPVPAAPGPAPAPPRAPAADDPIWSVPLTHDEAFVAGQLQHGVVIRSRDDADFNRVFNIHPNRVAAAIVNLQDYIVHAGALHAEAARSLIRKLRRPSAIDVLRTAGSFVEGYVEIAVRHAFQRGVIPIPEDVNANWDSLERGVLAAFVPHALLDTMVDDCRTFLMSTVGTGGAVAIQLCRLLQDFDNTIDDRTLGASFYTARNGSARTRTVFNVARGRGTSARVRQAGRQLAELARSFGRWRLTADDYGLLE